MCVMCGKCVKVIWGSVCVCEREREREEGREGGRESQEESSVAASDLPGPRCILILIIYIKG